jgi:hypothetical protein
VVRQTLRQNHFWKRKWTKFTLANWISSIGIEQDQSDISVIVSIWTRLSIVAPIQLIDKLNFVELQFHNRLPHLLEWRRNLPYKPDFFCCFKHQNKSKIEEWYQHNWVCWEWSIRLWQCPNSNRQCQTIPNNLIYPERPINLHSYIENRILDINWGVCRLR